MKPTVSIVIPAYNASKYIGECIESILNQTLQDFELIIVNDCSTDDTLDTIKKYTDKRIIIINNNTNYGVAKSLNDGIKIAKGKYIAIMDSDDVMIPERLQITYDYLENNKKVFLVGGALYYMEDNGEIIQKDIPQLGFEKIKQRLKRHNCLWHNTIMFRNDKKTFYREKFRYSQDYDFYTLLITRGKRIENITQVLAKYRVHKNSTSYSKRTQQNMLAKKISQFYNQRLKTGKDKYDNFDPEKILHINIEQITDKKTLSNETRIHWIAKDYNATRRFAAKYIRHYGIFNKQTSYYIASYMPKISTWIFRKLKKLLRIKNG